MPNSTRPDTGPVQFSADAGQTLLPVKVNARAGKRAITGIHAGRLKISVTSPPEKGKANKQVLELVSSLFQISKQQISIAHGEHSPLKTLLLDLPPATVSKCLREKGWQ
ncbi:DUF167 domain-containing protein [Planctomycetota bacterium]